MNSVGCDSALNTILDKLSVAALETCQISWDRDVILWRMRRVLEYAILSNTLYIEKHRFLEPK